MSVQEQSAQSPLACNINPFSSAQRARWLELGRQWRGLVEEMRELPDGIALRLPADAAAILAAAEWMSLDRLCCPFLTFALELEREGGPLWLRLTGREGTKAFLLQAASGEQSAR